MVPYQLQRSGEYLRRLQNAVKQQYGISADSITPAARGFYAETWKLSGDGGCYFLKADSLPFHQTIFRNSLEVIEYFCENGIDFAGKILRTRENKLYACFGSAVMGLFEWGDVENTETDQTKAEEYRMLCDVYRLTRPGLDIPEASFSDGAAVRFYKQWEALKKAPSDGANAAVLSVLERHEEELSRCASRLSQFAVRCRTDCGGFTLTHGDAGGNFFTGGGRNYIFDWDEVMYAPPERDAWVMGCFDWARNLFDSTLKACGIPYSLRPERLAFYCFHMYFHYLGEYLAVHPFRDQSAAVTDYLENGWIRSRIRYAETL